MRLHHAFVYVVCILLLLSCNNGTSDAEGLRSWVSMEDAGYSTVRVTVRVEGPDGNTPTSARVLLVSPSNSVSWCYYDNATAIYKTSLHNPASGLYEVFISSTLGESSHHIQYLQISENPSLVAIYDSAGNTGTTGLFIDPALSVNISWTPVANATVYMGTIISDSAVVYSFSAIETAYLVPESTLSADMYYCVRIEAQYISGDPFLIKENYYAYSYSEGPEYYFTTQ